MAKLRVVDPTEVSAEPRELSLADAVREGTPREVLMARRAAVVAKMANCHPRDHHALDRRLEAIIQALAALDVQEAEADDDRPTPDEAWTAV